MQPGKHNFPTRSSPFFGRYSDIEAVRDLLNRARLVTVTGAPGIGKSSLVWMVGFELANIYPVCWIQISSRASPEHFYGQLRDSFSIGKRSGASLAKQVCASLRQEDVVIILDACESAKESSNDVCSTLLAGCPHVRILAASRKPLALEHEVAYELRGMQLPPCGTASFDDLLAYDSSRLFLDHLCMNGQDFPTDGEPPSIVADVCNKLGGHPLALQIAASHAGLVGLPEVAMLFREGLPKQDPARVSDFVADTIRWAYETLSPQARQALCYLSVFENGFSAAAANEVCCLTDAQLRPVLEELCEARLAVAGWAEGGDLRFQLPDAVVEFARSRCNDSDCLVDAMNRFRAYYSSFIVEAAANLHGKDQRNWLDRIEPEYPNLVKVLESGFNHGQPTTETLLFFVSLGEVWLHRGPLDDARAFAQRVVELSPGLPPLLEAGRALNLAATVFLNTGWFRDARNASARGRRLMNVVGDTLGEALALGNLAVALRNMGHLTRAIRFSIRSVAMLRQENDDRRLATALVNLGALLEDAREHEAAFEAFSEAMPIWKAAGNQWAYAWTRANLAELALSTNKPGDAIAQGLASLQCAAELGDHRLIRLCLDLLALSLAKLAHLERAAVFLGGGDQQDGAAGVPRSSRLTSRLRRLAQRLKATLGEPKFNSLRQSAAALSIWDLAKLAAPARDPLP